MRIALSLLLVAVASTAFALMPPHVTRVEPGAGQSLIEGRIVKFHGYSLTYGAEVEARDAAGQPVVVQSFMWSRQECRGRPGPCGNSGGPAAPGEQQTYCVLSVKLPPVTAGAVYTVSLLGNPITVIERDGAYVVRTPSQ